MKRLLTTMMAMALLATTLVMSGCDGTASPSANGKETETTIAPTNSEAPAPVSADAIADEAEEAPIFGKVVRLEGRTLEIDLAVIPYVDPGAPQDEGSTGKGEESFTAVVVGEGDSNQRLDRGDGGGMPLEMLDEQRSITVPEDARITNITGGEGLCSDIDVGSVVRVMAKPDEATQALSVDILE